MPKTVWIVLMQLADKDEPNNQRVEKVFELEADARAFAETDGHFV